MTMGAGCSSSESQNFRSLIFVGDVLVVELREAKELDDAHMPPAGRLSPGRMQCPNYLKATGLQLCLLLNFGKPRLEIKRVVQGR